MLESLAKLSNVLGNNKYSYSIYRIYHKFRSFQWSLWESPDLDKRRTFKAKCRSKRSKFTYSKQMKIIHHQIWACISTRFFYNQRFFFNPASVFLNFFINWASNVAWVLLDTYEHDRTGTLFMFTIFVSISRSRSIYVVSACTFFIFIFIFIMINRIIFWGQTHLFFCLFFRVCPIIFGR